MLSNLTIKLIDRCDCQCDYCYYRAHITQDRMVESRLNEKTFVRAITQYYEYVSTRVQKNDVSLHITLHGGEPLLYGARNLALLLQKCGRSLPSSVRVFIRFQTNGYGITPEWIELFKICKIYVGISIDGPAELHEKHRVNCGGSDNHVRLTHNVKKMLEENIPFGVLTVITKSSIGAEKRILNYFRELGVPRFDIIPCISKDNTLRPSSKELALFWSHLYDLWLEHGRTPDIIYFSDLERKLSYLMGKTERPKGLLCELTSCCGDNMSMDTRGNLFFCECLTGRSDMEIGNIYEQTISEVIENEPYKTLRAKSHPSHSCSDCFAYDLCVGGCMARRFNTSQVDVTCSARKVFIKKLFNSYV